MIYRCAWFPLVCQFFFLSAGSEEDHKPFFFIHSTQPCCIIKKVKECIIEEDP